MYRFKLMVITRKEGLAVKGLEVFAPNMEAAVKKAQSDVWWDCYQPEEVEINFTGKCKV